MEQQEQRATFAIAPMIDISNTHFRYFIRLITAKAVVYTEMLHHDAVLHSHSHLLPFNVQEHPIVLQLGGCDPQKLAQAAKLGEQYGYDEINLNVGCPSPRVQKGSFGACLMKEPILVRECMQAMAKAVSIRCTVKCRLGVDEFDTFQFLVAFVKEVSGGGAGAIKHFVIHARKAILKGLNPAQNRSIPPLIYQRVYLLKKEFPELTFQLNGGLKNVAVAKKLVDDHNLQGCMVGRLAYENPFELMTVDEIFYGEPNYRTRYATDAIARRNILIRYADYVEKLQEGKVTDGLGNVIRKPNPSVLVKPLINLYNGEKFNGRYRQYLSDLAKLKEGPLHLVIRKAAELMWEDGFRYKKRDKQGIVLPLGQGQQQQKQEVQDSKQQKQVKQ